MNHNDERDYAEEMANRHLIEQEQASEARRPDPFADRPAHKGYPGTVRTR